jgi:hypothetical protein
MDVRANMLWSSAYSSTLIIIDGNVEGGIKLLRDIILTSDSLNLREIVIVAKRLLGETLLVPGSTQASREEALRVLQEALNDAKQRELAHEIRWISDILARSPT